MTSNKRRLIFAGLLIAALLIPTTMAFAKELGGMEISGPGISGTLKLDDHDEMMKFEQSGFFFSIDDGKARIQPLENPGKPFVITRYLNMENGPIKWDTFEYYPNAIEGQGVLHYLGPIDKSAGGPADMWAKVTQGEHAFYVLMKAHGVTSLAEPAPRVSTADTQPDTAAKPSQAEAVKPAEPAVSAPSQPQEPVVKAPAQGQPSAPVVASDTPAAQSSLPLGWIAAVTAVLVAAAGVIIITRQRRHTQSVSAGQD